MRERILRRATLIATIAVALVACGQSRRQEVADRGADVMPFDLEATTHEFTPAADGGTQTVTSDDPQADDQVALIRDHLRAEGTAFAAGDFADPVDIHGADMPGVAALSAGADRVDVAYEDIDAGARLVFTTADPELVTAVHDWFTAQTADHGSHAEQP